MTPWRWLVTVHQAVSKIVLGRKRVEREAKRELAAAKRLLDMETRTTKIEKVIRPIARKHGLVLPNGDEEKHGDPPS